MIAAAVSSGAWTALGWQRKLLQRAARACDAFGADGARIGDRSQRIPVSRTRLTVSFCPLETVTVLLVSLERYSSDCARIR
jgi:hypothetical protein